MKPLVEVTRQAIEILSRELARPTRYGSSVNSPAGHGDYTTARETLFGQATLEGIIAEIKSTPKP